MGRPRLADLCCKAGGTSMGYHMAGFEVVGFDVEPQPHYPFEFRQADLLDLDPAALADEFDAIAASPPCQRHTTLAARQNGRVYPDLIPAARALAQATGLPYVIENVPGAPLLDPVQVCGSWFGLRVRRHRLFECSWVCAEGTTCAHDWQSRHRPYAALQGPSKGATRRRSGTISVHGGGQIEGGGERFYKAVAMGIDWMTAQELNQAIPPVYTLHIGRQLIRQVRRKSPRDSLF